MRARGRTAAVLEVLGVYLAGQLVTGQLIRWLGVTALTNPLGNFTADVTDAELLGATHQLVVLLAWQYAGWFLLIIPINGWHRRQGPAAYGLTRAGHSWRTLLLAGLATAALSLWPTLSLDAIDGIYNLGETAPWRQALFDTSWRRWEFWLFTAALSWALVAFLEELFFRGYCQRRLAEDWGDGAAIIGISCLFVFSHGQYLIANPYSVAKLASLLVVAVGSGVAFARTRSLVPSFVSHALGNVPMTPVWQGMVVGALVVGAWFAARPGAAAVKRVFSGARVATCGLLGMVGMAYAIAAQRVDGLAFAAVGMLVAAVALEAVDRQQRTSPRRPVATSA
jgi:membrane protease YdiL (CAAX protease family)